MKEFLNTTIELGSFELSFRSILLFFSVIAAAQVVIWSVRYLLRKFLRNTNFEEGTRFMVMRLVRTVVYFLVIVVALDTAGIDLTVFWASSAALLVGVGIGLQNFFNDVVSGFVLLFEGGVRVGDELEVDGMMVRVERIDLRSTRVITRFGNLIVIPNGLISGQTVRNFTQGENATMVQLDVGVAYGSDVERVKAILLEAANAEEGVVKKAQTAVLFNDFGESSLQFTVCFWIEKPFLRKLISSNIRFRIDEAFRANGIRIPFPQRDVHVHQVPAEAG
ncbi:MAG: mechanosensitive ion channel protein MscS [Crocinitomicaceae bacterium]|nr:mechanosensitive ion channel protein MscS [Crocinitomicaceae bacterium]MEE3164475.1 mechanosensitive ion channel domain-containing protein [Bacteroidota bacterium]